METASHPLTTFISGNIVAALSYLATAIAVFLIHEAGHYFAARLCSIGVNEVTIGFGREVWKRVDSSGTRWSVRIFPFCGMVHIAQEEDTSRKRKIFGGHKLRRRMTVVAAGPLANVALAIVLFALFFTSIGQPVTPPLLTGIEVGSPAEKAGLKPGDRVLAIGNDTVDNFNAVSAITDVRIGTPLQLTVQRNGKIVETAITPYLARYIDIKGFPRVQGRTGMLALHQPLLLTAVTSVAGKSTGGDEARAREMLKPHLGQETVIGIKAVDGASHRYRIRPNKAMNTGLSDPRSSDYSRLYLGTVPGNFYLREPLPRAIAAAYGQTVRLAGGIVGVAGRIGHIDRSLVLPEETVSGELDPLNARLFAFVYMTAFFSLCIAFINILPLPGTDGAFLLHGFLEAAAGDKDRAQRMYPYALRLTILFQLGILALLNLEGLRTFIK